MEIFPYYGTSLFMGLLLEVFTIKKFNFPFLVSFFNQEFW